ncbi:MAG: ABC transporter permease subunit [Clostridiales bacterium]|nr:MAG: ABC transporter permease subunit [Clostridiales bacterium]
MRLQFFTTVVGTAVGMFLMTSTAYPLSRADYKFKGPLSFYVYFTMLFNGGMVANYIWITRYLNLYNSVWALILPGLMSASNLLILRTFFKTVPISLIESAKLEGASEFRIYLTIVIPLAKAGIATIMLITAFTYWNEWMRSMLYMDQGDKLYNSVLFGKKILEEVNLAKGIFGYDDRNTAGKRISKNGDLSACGRSYDGNFPVFFQKIFL